MELRPVVLDFVDSSAAAVATSPISPADKTADGADDTGAASCVLAPATSRGMATGQKVHCWRSADQYRSTISRRYPTVNRFEMHSVAALSSYTRFPKHAAESDTDGCVTKLIGIWADTSLSLCRSHR